MSLPGFDPNAAASAATGIFGLPFTEAEAALVCIPVPWEVTTSFGGGTSRGPVAIREASCQVDLFDPDVPHSWAPGIFMQDMPADILLLNGQARKEAQAVMAGMRGQDALDRVNQAGERLNQHVYRETARLLAQKKIPAIVGGDHSVPFGAFQAIGEVYPSFGILHVDAHSDTRRAYGGFVWSHASIMYNALEQIPALQKMVQVGIRDLCEEEYDYTFRTQKDRVQVYFDASLSQQKLEGGLWSVMAREMIADLPGDVWISFDIDGLDPQFCPHTGTPVPGGLTFSEAIYLIRLLAQSGRRIVGFDLNEVVPDPDRAWDENVGARLLYKMATWTFASQGLVTTKAEGR